MPEYVKTDRNTGEKDVTEKEAVQYKFCAGAVYRRTDENLKIRNTGFEGEQTFMRLSCQIATFYT